jgi:hypothetical protein
MDIVSSKISNALHDFQIEWYIRKALIRKLLIWNQLCPPWVWNHQKNQCKYKKKPGIFRVDHPHLNIGLVCQC